MKPFDELRTRLVAFAFSGAQFRELLESIEHSKGAALLPPHVPAPPSAENKRGREVSAETFPKGVYFVGWDFCLQNNAQPVTFFG